MDVSSPELGLLLLSLLSCDSADVCRIALSHIEARF